MEYWPYSIRLKEESRLRETDHRRSSLKCSQYVFLIDTPESMAAFAMVCRFEQNEREKCIQLCTILYFTATYSL